MSTVYMHAALYDGSEFPCKYLTGYYGPAQLLRLTVVKHTVIIRQLHRRQVGIRHPHTLIRKRCGRRNGHRRRRPGPARKPDRGIWHYRGRRGCLLGPLNGLLLAPLAQLAVQPDKGYKHHYDDFGYFHFSS